MILRFLAAAFLAATMSAGPARAAVRAPMRKPAQHPVVPAADWSRVARFTPAGSVLVGNPQAKVQLVAYLSFTCPHCAAFAAEGMTPLIGSYVRPGRVNVEFRSAVRDGIDLVDWVAARCGGPGGVVPIGNALFAAQNDIILGVTDKDPPEGLDPVAQMRELARRGGIDRIAAAHGVPPARLDACFASKAELDRVAAMQDEAWNRRRISGTPTFLVNGATSPARSWPDLKTALDAALR